MNGEVLVNQTEVEALSDALSEAAKRFSENFENLDITLNHLVTSGFTGEAADTLLNTYSSRVRPDLDSINKVISEATNYSEIKVEDTKTLMNNLDNIANG